ncbi:MAG TPA: ATP-binding protein [Adhaeribacter sp.]|nr:ATP-binding protein [Adhaeribacter sp.]
MQRIIVKLQAAIDLLPDAVIVVNQDVKIVAANPQVEIVFGYQPGELLHKHLNILIPERFHKRHNVHFRHYFEAPTKRRMGAGLDLAGCRKGGEEIDIDIALAPVTIGQQQMAMAIIRDITALKELERSLLKQNEELSLSNTRLERLGYVIAHDLKSPLLNINAISKLLNRELKNKSTKKIKSYTKALQEITHSMMNLITGVADYSKTRFQDTAEEEVDLNQIIKEVHRLVHFPPYFRLHVKGQLPVINGNRTKILQIFLNLVNNAVKYNDKPKGVVEIQARANDKVCLINVADNGPGVPEELRGKVFELFRKGHIDKEGSQGIGLAVVKKIIEDRGGHIMVEESELGGANFVFGWPAVSPEPEKGKETASET